MSESTSFITADDIGRHPTVFGQGVIGSIDMWGSDLRTGWFPCENPERQTDPYVLWHYEGDPCTGCRIAAKALFLRNPDDKHVQWLVDRLKVA